jgi:hypothetical protein
LIAEGDNLLADALDLSAVDRRIASAHSGGSDIESHRSITGSGRHLEAMLGAASARFDAILHVADTLAVVGALLADFRALPGQSSAQAIISRKCFGSTWLPLCSRQWGHRRAQAGLVTVQTFINTGLHLFGNIAHDCLLAVWWCFRLWAASLSRHLFACTAFN